MADKLESILNGFAIISCIALFIIAVLIKFGLINILMFLLCASPLILVYIVLLYESNKTDKRWNLATETAIRCHRCKMCRRKKIVECTDGLFLTSFKMVCDNERCKNYGLRSKTYYVDDIIKESEEE